MPKVLASKCMQHLPPQLSVSVLTVIFQVDWVSRYQNVYILDFIGSKGDGRGGNNWSFKVYTAPVKMSPSTNQHAVLFSFFTGQMPSCCPTNSVKTPI